MEQPGVLEWCNSTRFAMINDPGRQLFQDQINTHGFLFLNDYLDNILAGPRRDPLIELVKTPGRKKTTNKRPVAATSGLKNVTVSLEVRSFTLLRFYADEFQDDNDAGSKENLPPVNSFHRGLLQVKEKTPPPKAPSHESHPRETPMQAIDEQPLPPQASRPHDPAQNPASFSQIQEVVQPPRQSHVDEIPDSSKDLASDPVGQVNPVPTVTPVHIPSPPRSVVCDNEFAVQPAEEKPQFLAAVPAEQNDLSMIVEDDETDRSRISLPGTEVHAPVPEVGEVGDETAPRDSLPAAIATIAAPLPSADTFHTIPLSPAQPEQLPDPVPSPVTFHHRSPSPSSPHESPLPETVSDTRSTAEYHTAPLPEIPRHSRDAHSEMTEPLPAVTEETSNVEMTDVAAEVPHTSPKGLTHKASVPSFPSLPSLPLPFRKSVRVPSDPVVAPGPLGAATPGGALGGKRTSWLMRAREVKALEITVKKPNPAPSLDPGMPSGHKRKSGDMFGVPGVTGLEEEERRPKAAKTVEDDAAPLRPRTPESTQPKAEQDIAQPSMQPQEVQEGLLVQLKRTVDDLGSRFGKSTGKSLGGTAAASALAEARAAAEARLVERQHKEEEATMALGAPAAPARSSTEHPPVFHSSHSRLSVSELVVTSPENRGKGKELSDRTPESLPSVQDARLVTRARLPLPHLPPLLFSTWRHPLRPPVFNKPPPVFVPPAPAPISEPSTFKMPVTTAFSKPASMALGLASRLPSPKQTAPVPLSAQSTLESIRSDRLFDSQTSQDDAPAWMPSTQDTEYTTGFGSQSQCSPIHGGTADLDDDDSWPLAERVGAWFGLNAKEDTGTTWSSQPTQSQRIDPDAMPQDVDAGFIAQEETGLIQGDANVSHTNIDREFHQPIPGSFRMDLDDDEEDNDDRAAAFDQSVLGEMEIDPSKSTVSLVEPRSQSQMSQMSTASSSSSQSQSQGGFLGHASKLMNSVLGTSKKAKPEVKSLQLAAIAAKKQQEEKEKKASMLKNMEARRQAHLQRKAEEEKAKALEEERKLKEERDRLKKEREEYTGKQPLLMKSVGPKKEEEKKRKIVGEVDKKPELKKPTLKQPALNASTSSKLLSKTPVTKPPPSALASSATYNAASSSKLTESNVAKLQGKGKLPAKNIPAEDDVSQPSLLLQSQMAARAKAQMQAANPAPPPIPSESIELPDINSEYSDSDDEDRPRTFDPPSWAQDTMLQQALQVQSTINPDDIFGAVRPLKMDEVFRNRTGRFRARTSSANWTGTDRLTVEEEREYARRMGFR
ncbi:INCENP-ARK-bind domain-containing protein [Mycena sanguinolenta]|uniref:INCENP-ARK-bind domain-containing protein n=1 Tax=Mycena sanguinolenta TaxID=230812 RepID=A0A8H6XFD0_9AGAR|nr:INCENP-ARK-bind domain-containing protein [Mycena sanguinolenta]